MNQLNYLKPALVGVHLAWLKVLSAQNLYPIEQLLQTELKAGNTIYPPAELTFNALRFTSPQNVCVVILGQDPYHGSGQAMGMSFSVPPNIKIPPSLRNVYKELSEDIASDTPKHGDLSAWSKQGVLLLNSVFTVRAECAGSHKKFAWQAVSDALINLVNTQSRACVFMLWGNWAISKAPLIDASRHLILSAAHPSPFAAHRGFFGCKHFSQANAWLKQHQRDPINWAAINATSNLPG